jgi:hypothetical protein
MANGEPAHPSISPRFGSGNQLSHPVSLPRLPPLGPRVTPLEPTRVLSHSFLPSLLPSHPLTHIVSPPSNLRRLLTHPRPPINPHSPPRSIYPSTLAIAHPSPQRLAAGIDGVAPERTPGPGFAQPRASTPPSLSLSLCLSLPDHLP